VKALLAVIAAFAVAGAVVVNWAPGGDQGAELFTWLAFKPTEHATLLTRAWTFLTSGVLTSPVGIGHAFFALLGLYFLTPDLERRWGSGRLLRFVALAVLGGNLAVLAGTWLPLEIFRPKFVLGPSAAITAIAIAWSNENRNSQVYLFFFPVSARTLYWLTIGFAVLSIVFLQGAPEGALALLGGVGVGALFSGAPSPARTLWLRIKLATMRRRAGGGGITVEQLLSDDPPRPRSASRRSGKAPPLRIVQGGLDDDLKNRKPPKDKRYLN
jgi:membrane associated rhomboid family serine protease